MIGHIEHGSDFGGLFRYLLAEDKGARIIGGNAAGRTPGELTQEFNNCADQRRTTKKPVKHLIVSFATADGYVADEVKARIATEAVKELGYTYNQYVVVDHHRDDPGHDWNHDHDHIHIAVNMITLDGKRVDDWQDKRSFEEILRQLEVKEKLTTVTPSKNRKRKALSHGQTQRIKREIKEYKQGERTTLPEIPLSIKLQAAIDNASKDKPDLTTFIGRLQGLDIDVRPTISDKGRKRISYRLSDLKVRGSKLHNASFPKLISQRGLDFDYSRDKLAMDLASLGQRVSIPTEKRIAWSEIELESYLPEALKNELTGAQTKLEQRLESQLSNSLEDEETNQQPTELTDSKLLEIKSNVKQWLSSRPPEPRQEIIDSIQTEINRLKRLLASGEQRINYQKQQLEQLSPRSLLNPFGVSPDLIEQKKTNIQLNQSKLRDIQRELATANGNLEKWQKKVQVYQDWHTSTKTQEMNLLAQLLLTPDNIDRLNKIEEGYRIYDCASYILKQLGTSSGGINYFQGKLYRLEERNQTLTISRPSDDSIIYEASYNREQGGIIEIEEFNLTQADCEKLDESVRALKQSEKLNRQKRSKGFSLG